MRRLLLLVILLLTSSSSYASPASVKLGFITDLTGIGSYWGTQSQRGVTLAQREIQKEGGDLEVTISDHTFKPMVALTETQRLIHVEKADALWVEFAPTVVAASGAVAQAHKLFIANSAATSILKTNPYAFKAYLDYERGCAAIAQHWRSQGLRKIGMLKLNAEFAELCLQGAIKEFPDLTVMTYEFGESVKSQVLILKAKGIEAIFNTALEADMLNTLKALRELNYRVRIGVSEPEGLTDQVRSHYGDRLQGVTSFGFPPISEEFKTKFKASYPDAPSTALEGAAMAYTHSRQIFAAFKMCPTRGIECVAERMASSPPDPTLQFLRWEKRIAVYDFTLKEWQNGNLVTLRRGI